LGYAEVRRGGLISCYQRIWQNQPANVEINSHRAPREVCQVASTYPRCALAVLLLLSAIGLAGTRVAAFAEKAPEATAQAIHAVSPLEVSLVSPIEAGRTKVGDPVLARVEVAWETSGCSLHSGAIIEGRLVAADERTRTQKNSEVSISFEKGDCVGHPESPLLMTVVAVTAPNRGDDPNFYESPALNANALNLSGGFRSVSDASAQSSAAPLTRRPVNMKAGNVIGLSRISLKIGGGPEHSSVLSSSSRNVRLERGTEFVLLASNDTGLALYEGAKAVSDAPASVRVPAATLTKRPDEEPEPVDETELCKPDTCTLAASAKDEAATAEEAMNIPVSALGFAPRFEREITSFNTDTAIAYLGTDHLLLTFNPHQLVQRSAGDGTERSARMIHAALLNTTTRKVERELEWRVPGRGQYVWEAGPDHVLIHVGRELRLYGPGLKLESKYLLDGPLGYVSLSPSGQFAVVGVLRERHTAETHARLEELTSEEPEEDLDVRILDHEMKVLSTMTRSSRAPVPVLSDAGEILITRASRGRWQINEFTWNSQTRKIATVVSACRPAVSSEAGEMLFLVGCQNSTDQAWYRMVHLNGKPVVKGYSPSEERERSAMTSGKGMVFAISVIETSKPGVQGGVFDASDLESQWFNIYRKSDGRLLMRTKIHKPVPSKQTFALSQSGEQLAVLQGDRISIYNVPAQ
jgi:hypothetical protein